MTDMHTDGNEIAGTLAEFFAADPTATRRRCQSCRGEHPLAEHLAYRGAGLVLRCPDCGDVALVIGECGRDLVIEWRGAFRAPRAT